MAEKRKAQEDSISHKRQKLNKLGICKQTRAHWTGQKRAARPFAEASSIQPGDAGIWATCDKGQEAKCVRELRDLFEDYSEKLYGDDINPADHTANRAGTTDEQEDGADLDIEASIQTEVTSMRKPQADPLFKNIRIDMQCVCFVKTRPPVDPVALVRAICADAGASRTKRTRFVKRLTPVTLISKANEKDLDRLARVVLAPHFHGGHHENGADSEQGPGQERVEARTFSIRPTLRNHDKTLTREGIIEQVAKLVGPPHRVNLGMPERTILVEVYKNLVGMSVVGEDYESLKRYNVDQIFMASRSEDDADAEAHPG